MNARDPGAGCNCEHLHPDATCFMCSLSRQRTGGMASLPNHDHGRDDDLDDDVQLLTDGGRDVDPVDLCRARRLESIAASMERVTWSEVPRVGVDEAAEWVQQIDEAIEELAGAGEPLVATDGGRDLQAALEVAEAQAEFHKARAEFIETFLEHLLDADRADRLVETLVGGVEQ